MFFFCEPFVHVFAAGEALSVHAPHVRCAAVPGSTKAINKLAKGESDEILRGALPWRSLDVVNRPFWVRLSFAPGLRLRTSVAP